MPGQAGHDSSKTSRHLAVDFGSTGIENSVQNIILRTGATRNVVYLVHLSNAWHSTLFLRLKKLARRIRLYLMRKFINTNWKTLLFFAVVGLWGGYFVGIYQLDIFLSPIFFWELLQWLYSDVFC